MEISSCTDGGMYHAPRPSAAQRVATAMTPADSPISRRASSGGTFGEAVSTLTHSKPSAVATDRISAIAAASSRRKEHERNTCTRMRFYLNLESKVVASFNADT